MSDPRRLTPETACRKSHRNSPRSLMCDTILPNTPLSGSEQTENEVSQSQWPEKGDPWNEGDNDMDCELQQMAEEDEMIDLYNEETFGLDLDSEDTVTGGDSSRPLLQFGETPPVPHISPPPTPRSLSPSPPKQHRPQYMPTCPAGQRGRGRGLRGQRGGQRKPQMFEDPAVMRTVEGRPTLKSLDSAIVECGTPLSWSGWDENWMSASHRRTRKTSGSILQDNAIVYMIDGHDGRGHHPTSKFLVEPPYPFPSFRGRSGSPRRPYYNRSFSPRCTPQMNSVMPQSPLLSRQPLAPRQHYNQNQTGGFRFPLGRPCSPSHSMAPKMMQLRFGTNSPRPSPVYSPSSNPVQRFSYPGPVTQLHPQHKRQIIQKFRTIQRKPERWDPYCDLMTAKEKEWIIRLQMIQLQSENPYREDYYYQEYYRRLEAKLTEEELGIRSKKELPKLTTPYITKPDAYTPVVHIEGSLGQVAVSTCYSPRRAIGPVHAAKVPHKVPHKVPNEEQKDTRQQRLYLLNKIEQLFIVLMEVEDAERVKSSVLTEAEEKKLRENTQGKVKHIHSELQDHDALELGEEFLPCLLISKGKKLLARLIQFLDHDSTLHILRVVSSHLHTLMARDADESLPVLFPPLRIVIGGLNFSQLVGVLKILTISESLTYANNINLPLTCQNKFGLSLLYALLSQGEKLLSSGAPLEPSIGDFEIWTDSIFQVAGQLSQCSLVEPLFMPPNLLTLFCRYLDKRTVHQLKSNLESATGFLALAS